MFSCISCVVALLCGQAIIVVAQPRPSQNPSDDTLSPHEWFNDMQLHQVKLYIYTAIILSVLSSQFSKRKFNQSITNPTFYLKKTKKVALRNI